MSDDIYEFFPDTVREYINGYLEQCDTVMRTELYCTERDYSQLVLNSFLNYVLDVCAIEHAKNLLQENGYTVTKYTGEL